MTALPASREGFAFSSVLPGAKTSAHSSRRASFPSPWRYHGCLGGFAPLQRPMRRCGAGVFVQGGHPMRRGLILAHAPPVVRGNRRISQVPAETLAAMHMLLRPRKNRTKLALSLRPARPRQRERPWLLQLDFRGSIAWLDDSLSTLRAAGCPAFTQDSLPAAWLRSAGWGLHPLGFPRKGFSYVSVSHIILLSRTCLAQSRFLCPRYSTIANGCTVR